VEGIYLCWDEDDDGSSDPVEIVARSPRTAAAIFAQDNRFELYYDDVFRVVVEKAEPGGLRRHWRFQITYEMKPVMRLAKLSSGGDVPEWEPGDLEPVPYEELGVSG
jgi:hypothetical protein